MGTIRPVALIVGLVLLAGLVSPAGAAPAKQVTSAGVAAAQAALSKRGYSYVWGAKGPTAFDCSGLTHWAWAQAGYEIGISTYDQATAGTPIACNLSNLFGASTTCWQPGDLIFLSYTGGRHVAIYAGNGLFVDAYHPTTGVIVHNPAADSFYQAHFWQARRITSDNAGAVNPGASDSVPTNTIPGLEDIPDIMGQVSVTVPQCGSCNPDGSTLLAPRPWGESWPSGWETLNLALVFQKVISWLSWQISEYIRQLICWLLTMLAILASILSAAANTLIYGVNSLFKMLVLMWLALRAYFYSLWEMLESVRWLLAQIGLGLAGLAELGRLIAEVALLIAALIGQLLVLLGQIGLALIGIVAWIGGLVLTFFVQLQLALSGTTAPTQLTETHIVYYATRGTLEGIRDSHIGWMIVVFWGLSYVAFITWASRFFSSGKDSA